MCKVANLPSLLRPPSIATIATGLTEPPQARLTPPHPWPCTSVQGGKKIASQYNQTNYYYLISLYIHIYIILYSVSDLLDIFHAFSQYIVITYTDLYVSSVSFVWISLYVITIYPAKNTYSIHKISRIQYQYVSII